MLFLDTIDGNKNVNSMSIMDVFLKKIVDKNNNLKTSYSNIKTKIKKLNFDGSLYIDQVEVSEKKYITEAMINELFTNTNINTNTI
jgi:hypothetical protein